MKITCHRESMLSSFGLVAGATDSKGVKPILRNVKCIATDERCTLMATDLELGIRLEVRAVKVDEPGEAILPLAKMMAIFRESVDEEMTVEYVNQKVIVRGERGKWEMASEAVEGFPDVPEFDADAHHEVSGKVLRELIDKTSFGAAPMGKMGFATTGVLVEAVDNEMAMIATNGGMLIRLHGVAKSVGEHSTEGKTRIMPVKALAMIERNIGDPDEVVRVCLRDNDALVKTERATIYTRLIEGRFPSYRNVIPPTYKFKATCAAGPLLLAIRQADVLTDAESIRVRFNFTKGKLALSAGGQAGASEVETAVECNGAFDGYFKPVDFTKPLEKMEPDAVVTFESNTADKPAKMTQGDYMIVAVPLVSTADLDAAADKKKASRKAEKETVTA